MILFLNFIDNYFIKLLNVEPCYYFFKIFYKEMEFKLNKNILFLLEFVLNMYNLNYLIKIMNFFNFFLKCEKFEKNNINSLK